MNSADSLYDSIRLSAAQRRRCDRAANNEFDTFVGFVQIVPRNYFMVNIPRDHKSPSDRKSEDGSSDQLLRGASSPQTDCLSKVEIVADLPQQDGHPRDIQKRLARISRADVDTMILNSQERFRLTGKDIYAGFRLIRGVATPFAEEEPYIGAFLPLDLAQEYPHLFGLPTLHYQPVYANEKLPLATMIIVAPGVLDELTVNDDFSCLSSCLSGIVFIAVASTLVYSTGHRLMHGTNAYQLTAMFESTLPKAHREAP